MRMMPCLAKMIRSGRAACLRLPLMAAFLALFSSPANAWCPPCTALPGVISQYIQVTNALSLMNQAIIMAVGLHGGGNGGAKMGEATGVFEAFKSMAGHAGSTTMRAVNRKINMETVSNAQSLNCRLHTVSDVVRGVEEKFQKQVAYNLENGVVGLFFNRSFTPERTRAAFLERNCKNGQLRQQDLGPNWWNTMNAASAPANRCFQDATDDDGDGVPDFSHAFVKPNTVMDRKVLVPPNQAQMDVLNNPESAALGGPQAVWNSLNPLQKAFVSSLRYCENLALTALQPMGVYGDAALTTSNMVIAQGNLAALAKLDALVYACRSEVARRTAPDPGSMAGVATMADYVGGATKVGSFLNKSGLNPKEFQVGGVTYVSPALASYARYEAFCNSAQTRTSFYADSGTDASKTQNIVKCEQLKMIYQETEQIHRSLFSNLAAGVARLEPQFRSAGAVSIRTENDGLIKKASFSEMRAPWTAQKKLVDMMRE